MECRFEKDMMEKLLIPINKALGEEEMECRAVVGRNLTAKRHPMSPPVVRLVASVIPAQPTKEKQNRNSDSNRKQEIKGQ